MTEAATKADFTSIRYAQVWEDADILVKALNIGPNSNCLSVASAGDNALAMLAQGPHKVYAIDLNPSQLHCLELRVAAFKALTHPELLELIGSRPSEQRTALYQRCREHLPDDAIAFWDQHPQHIEAGIGNAGKFENYFALFRNRIIPLIHNRNRIEKLLQPKSDSERITFYQNEWNNWRWRALFRVFFSRFVMGRLGRDPAFFNYVEGSVSDRILERTEYALTQLAPDANPYLQWILCGQHQTALPYYLREENFEKIRQNIDRIEWRLCTVEAFAEAMQSERFDAYNLSDIFEYMSEANTASILKTLVSMSNPGARIAYWNMLAPRSRPTELADQIAELKTLSDELFAEDKAFFYSRFVVEEVRAT